MWWLECRRARELACRKREGLEVAERSKPVKGADLVAMLVLIWAQAALYAISNPR